MATAVARTRVPEGYKVPDWQKLCKPAVTVASRRKADPAARGILVQITESGAVRVTGSDLLLWANEEYVPEGAAADSAITWEGVLPLKAGAITGPVTLTPNGPEITISVEGGGTYTIGARPADGFPPAPELNGEWVDVPGIGIAIRRVAPAMGSDKAAPVLMGLLIDPTGYAVASDGYIFIATTLSGAVEIDPVILPGSLVSVIRTAWGDLVDGYLMILDQGEEGRLVAIHTGTGWAVARAVAGDYPDWGRYLTDPSGKAALALVEAKTLEDAIDRATLIAEAAAPAVKLKIGPKGPIEVILNEAGRGSMQEATIVERDVSKSVEVLLHAARLSAVLQSAPDQVWITIDGERPIRVSSDGFDAICAQAKPGVPPPTAKVEEEEVT